jgi:cytochrome c oxidase subunit 2
MVDSALVLKGQTIAYTLYCAVIILLMLWFGTQLPKKGRGGSKVKPALFYTFVSFLAILGVSLHIITYNTIPWSEMDLNRKEIIPDKTFNITMADHRFTMPSEEIVINTGEIVVFDVTSHDLTYGFGLFRQDNSMLFQMQVIPGHRNDIMWRFVKPGVYSIRSTEYSGPKGTAMIVNDAVRVVGEPLTENK